MKTRHLRLLILFGSLVLTGLFLIQLYWFRKAFNVEEQRFDHSVQIALMRVADSVSSKAEVKKLSSTFYFVTTESPLDNEKIENLVKLELLKRNLLLEYELGVYNAHDDTLLYGQYVEGTRKYLAGPDSLTQISTDVIKNFAVHFPGKESHVIAQLDVWIFSTAALLLMLCFFAYAISTLLRERKFAELKNDFINNMTHEFKTPITNIGITAEIIRKKVSADAGINVYIDILLKENEKLRNKIENILLGSSVGQTRPALQRIDIHKLIKECADAFELKVRERNGLLRLELNAKSNFILGDRDLLTQAINNVIDNAEKYSPSNPHILVRTEESKKGIEIEIADKGVGIPAKLHKKVFDKFFRAQNGDVHNVKGFGLGLSFVKSVIRLHRGNVKLFSSLNEGTEVKIILPKT